MKCLFLVAWLLLLQQLSWPLVSAGRRTRPPPPVKAAVIAAPFGTCHYYVPCPPMTNGEGYYRVDLKWAKRDRYKTRRYPGPINGEKYLHGRNYHHVWSGTATRLYTAELIVFPNSNTLRVTCACIQVNKSGIKVKFGLRKNGNPTFYSYIRYTGGSPVNGYYKACASFGGVKYTDKLSIWVTGKSGSSNKYRNVYMRACNYLVG